MTEYRWWADGYAKSAAFRPAAASVVPPPVPLADNELSEVSEQIGRLKRLRTLDLGHNKLSKLPESLAEIEDLSDFLYLHDNRLTSLPLSLGRLTKLCYLNISENAFEVFRNACRVWRA
jgi:hypothetical protein